MLEEIELHDWSEDRNSISAYYLDRWYEKVKSVTFPTFIYKSIPEILPFQRCMVRYENKSPKDSEFWGPATTPEEVKKIFYTSLRCKTNPGKLICIREWIDDIHEEYRCFWNCGLVAANCPSHRIFEIINFVYSFPIPYYRCVLDIAIIKNRLYLIEFNSWEVNSGAKPFDWIDDTDIFYHSDQCVCRWLDESFSVETKRIKVPSAFRSVEVETLEILAPTQPSNWVVTPDYLYVANDIWLGRFTHDLQPINWKRGDFRFGGLIRLKTGCLQAGQKVFNSDLSERKHSIPAALPFSTHRYPTNSFFRYGFYGRNKGTVYFAKLNYDGTFTKFEIEI